MAERIYHPSSMTCRRRGVVLLVVLLMVIAITIAATGFLAQADVELSCGRNMALRTQIEQLADSALEHARGLVLHPQDISSFPWTATLQQLAPDSRDFYDVSVALVDSDPTDYCTYDIACEAYRTIGVEKVGISRLSARLRLDPCIALWTGTDMVYRENWACYGDLYGAGSVTNLGTIDGDAFVGALNGTVVGRQNPASPPPLAWPGVTVADFTSRCPTSPVLSGAPAPGTTYSPSRVWYRNGDLALNGGVTVEGMLLVNGNLTVQGTGNILTAGKNLPALYVTGNLSCRQVGDLNISGLAVVDGSTYIGADTVNARILGGLFTAQEVAETAIDSSGQGNDAIIRSQPTWHPAGGRTGGALEFDGVEDFLQTPDSATQLQLANDYTLSVWLKPASPQKRYAGIICKTDANGGTNQWTLQFNQASPPELVVYHDSDSWATGIVLSELTADGQWHHVAVVRQGDNMASYLDGNSRATGVWTRLLLTGNGHLNLAADRTGSSNFLYKGLLDDVRVYASALAQGDIAKIHSLTPIAATPIGHWKLDESGSQMTVIAEPAGAAVVVGPPGGEAHWSPAAGAFFKRIRRE